MNKEEFREYSNYYGNFSKRLSKLLDPNPKPKRLFKKLPELGIISFHYFTDIEIYGQHFYPNNTIEVPYGKTYRNTLIIET